MEKTSLILLHQYEAALSTLKQCIVFCPDNYWNERNGDYPFSQVAFHTLFYADYYLGKDTESFKFQTFHELNKEFFRDYEELEYREPVHLYEKTFILEYLIHCRTKAGEILAIESSQSLYGPSGFQGKPFSRMEQHIYNIRHIQHHAAQLGLRIQFKTGRELTWVGSGWRDLP